MSVKTLLLTKPSVVWLALAALTISSWGVGAAQGSGAGHDAAGLVIIFVAAFKVRVIGMYFMEIRDAPGVLRMIFEGYCVGLAILLSVMYLV